MIRILLVATDLGIGGAETILHRIAVSLPRDRYQVEAASLRDPPGAMASRLARDGVPVRSLGLARRRDAAGAVLRLSRLLGERAFDLVHTSLFHANIAGRFARALSDRGRRVAVVSSVHTAEARRPWRLHVDRLTASLADREVCISHALLRFTAERARVPRRKLVAIPNGVDVPATVASGRSDPGAPFLCVGRLVAEKGHVHLLRAWALLGADAPPLEIVGGGPLEAPLRAAAGPAVRFLGARDDVPRRLAGARGFVLASVEEGLPLAVLEAMAAGLPVVATRVGAIPEAIADGETGLLVPPRDPPALAAAVRAILRDPARAIALGDAARRRVERDFSARVMVARYEALYREVLGRAPRSSGAR